MTFEALAFGLEVRCITYVHDHFTSFGWFSSFYMNRAVASFSTTRPKGCYLLLEMSWRSGEK